MVIENFRDRTISEAAKKEISGRPILFQVGILDINHAFSLLPSYVIQSCGKMPHVKGEVLYPIIFDLRQALLDNVGMGQLSAKGYQNEHFLYPILERGILADIARTEIFSSLFGKHQLGLNRYSPLPNSHNRGEHSLYLAIEMLRTLQSLDEKDHIRLIRKLRNDFKNEGLPEPKSDEEVIIIATNLAATVAALHDLGTPAGGDTIKYVTGRKEEDVVEWFLSKKNIALRKQRDELLTVLNGYGLTPDHIRYLVRCIKEESNSLIGEMINPTRGDKLDWDRMSYTLLDLQAATLLSNEIPEVLLPKNLDRRDKDLIARKLDLGIKVIIENPSAVLGITGERLSDIVLLPTNYLDCSERFHLNSEDQLVCTDPQRLSWIAAYRLWMTTHYYAGAQMLGLEWELQNRLQSLARKGVGNKLLTIDNLITKTDEELFHQFEELGDAELAKIIRKSKTTGGTSRFVGRIVDADSQKQAGVLKSFGLNPKIGLDTLVSWKGKTITLAKYLEQKPESEATQFIASNPAGSRNKRVDISITS